MARLTQAPCDSRKNVIQVLAHRGYCGQARENSLAAFDAALQLGCTGIETDLRATADGVVVLMHDRLTPWGQAVEQLSHAALEQALGHEVATLEQALTTFPHCFWNLELKSAAAWQLAAPQLKRWRWQQGLISSFQHGLVLDACLRHGWSGGLLLAQHWLSPELMPCPQPHLHTLIWAYDMLNPELLAQSQALGWQHWSYSPLNRDEHQRCLDLGLHAVITDHPNWLLPAD